MVGSHAYEPARELSKKAKSPARATTKLIKLQISFELCNRIKLLHAVCSFLQRASFFYAHELFSNAKRGV